MNVSPFASHASAAAPFGAPAPHGEAVLVMPRQSCRIDDRVFASHAAFSWRTVTTSVPQPSGAALRYTSHKSICAFSEAALRGGLAVGDRITRSWDGVGFEIVGLFREAGALCCELRELPGQIH